MATYTGSDKRLQYLFQNGGGGGGTEVQANPQGTPTAYLNTIKIASSIYSVEKPADIYSTEERQVGVWIDGRPIYKRTYDLGSDVSVSYNSWTTLSNVIIPNLDFIVEGYGTNTGGTYTPLQTTWVVATHAIQIQTPRNNYTQNVRYFTIFYCKDNDVGGAGIWTPSGSYARHYSDDEQIIGSWRGKTLFGRIFDLGSDVNVMPTTWYYSSITITNLSEIIDCFGVNTSGTNYPLMAYHTNGTVNLLACRQTNAANVRYISLEYTKTA